MRIRLSVLAPSVFVAFALGFALALAPVTSSAQDDMAALKKEARQTADQAHKMSRDLHALARKKGIEPSHHRQLLEAAGKLEKDTKDLREMAGSSGTDAKRLQFTIQMGTSDLQNAENVRSQVEMDLKKK